MLPPVPHTYHILVAYNVRYLRKQACLSQEQLAHRSGVSLQQISRIERGVSSPSVDTLSDLADALFVDVVDFFADPTDESFTYYLTRIAPESKNKKTHRDPLY